ncbi:MAG: Ig-like domain repeat protein, partial [Nitrososphaerales archaeon]
MNTGNNNPVAVATANPTSGAPPLSVTFNGSGSSDPDPGTILSYSWNFGDGSPAASVAVVTHTYNSAGPFVATLTVNDGNGGTNSATVNITVGTPPVGTIDTPIVGTKYSGGNTITFSGSATDMQDGVLPANAFHWVIVFHHNTHTHPFLEFNGIKSGSFVIPTIGEVASDVFYRIQLTTTDSTGLTNLVTRDVLPNKSTITLASNVSGLQVNLDGQPQTTPHSFEGVVGITRTLQAPSPQSLGGQNYQFQSWSDGGAATHTISITAGATTYTANYVVVPPTGTTSSLTVNSQDMNGNTITGYWTVLQQGTTTIASGFTPVTFTLNNGVQYSVTAGDFGNFYFDHWLDTGSSVQPRNISISSNTQLISVYRDITAQASISITPASGPVGTLVSVTGTNFLPNTPITIRYDGNVITTTPSAITSNSVGGFSASFNVPTSTSAGHSVSATDGTRSASKTFTVNSLTSVASSTKVTSSINPSVTGQSVTFTATVTGSGGTPTGTVTFRDGTTAIGTGTLSGNTATFTTSSLTIGSHSITAVYSGNVNFNPSTSPVLTQTVNKGSTTTAVTSSVNPSASGQSVTFTATVSPVSPASSTLTGIVTFRDGTTAIGTGTLSGGVAMFTTTTLAVGSHSITAVYSGNVNFKTSTSPVLTQTVNTSSLAASSTTVSSNVNPSASGQSVTFTATVTGSGGTPTGTVTFRDGTTAIGTGTLSGGVAMFTTTTLAVGSHSITAVYSGNVNFNPSTSPVLTQTVNTSSLAASSTKVTSSINPSVTGQSVTFTATVTGSGGTPTGTVTFRDGT